MKRREARGSSAGASSARSSSARAPSARTPSARPAGARWQALLPVLFVAAVTVIAFLPALENGFTNWDDPEYVTGNYAIRDLSPDGVRKLLTAPLSGNYHPLTALSLAVDYHFWKLDPRGFHATSVALHVINTLLVLWLVSLLLRSTGAAVVAALFFGIHPLHVESVAWVSARKDVLYTAFYLLACVQYVLWVLGGRKRWPHYAATLALFGLALVSKPMAVTLPVALALIGYYIEKRPRWGRLALGLAPFFLLALAFGGIAVLMQRSAGAMQALTLFPIHERILFACYAILDYLARALAPLKLSTMYPYPTKTAGMLPAVFYIAPVLVAGLAAAVVWSARRAKEVPFGALFFLANVALVLQLIPVGNAIVADRYTYLAYVGLGFLLGALYRRVAGRPGAGGARIAALAFLAIAGGSMVAATRARCEVWRDSLSLWNDALSKYPTTALAYNNRALAYMTKHEYDLAKADLEVAISLFPNYVQAYLNRGNIAFLRGEYDAARADLERAVRVDSLNAAVWHGLAAVHGATGSLDRAIALEGRAIALAPDFPELYLNRGNMLSMRGDHARALADFNAFLRLEPGNAQAHVWRGLSKAGLGDHAGAIADYGVALTLDPKSGGAHIARSRSFAALGNRREALQDALQAQSLGAEVEPEYLARLRDQGG